MPIEPKVCASESTVTIEPLTCDKDSVTICPPGDAAPFHVIVDSSPPVSGTTGGATETTLAAILVELGQKLEPGGAVALDAATLVALENITVTVTNPTTNPETGLAKEVTLAALLTELGQKYEGGAIALDAPTLAALETVTVLQGTSPWVVDVGNFPAYTGLTNTELRATPVPVNDDYGSFEAQHVVLASSTDTTITFAQPVRAVHIKNWDIVSRVLVKDGPITSDGDFTASRVGKAPVADVAGSDWFPFATTSIHLRSAVGNEVTVEGYF